MPALTIGFEVHQPYRLNRHFVPDPKVKKKDITNLYFDDVNRELLLRIAEKCYIPATTMILDLLDEGFSCAFSLSGTLIEQLEKWSPDALSLFGQVALHRNAEILAQTYYHSIASCFNDKTEFIEQVRMHANLMHELFNVEPTIFENTEFTFNNDIAACIRDMGFRGIFTEGVDRILNWRSPNYLYTCRDIPVLLRNIQLSDDIAFRFTNRSWDKYPLTADTYAQWVAQSSGDVVNVFLDYESFGEHLWPETGIFEFLRHLPGKLSEQDVPTVLPSKVLADSSPVGTIDVHETISWADIEKDTSAWMGNDKQRTAFHALEAARVFAKDKRIWRYLQTSDHFYYMASKYGSCGEVHSYFCYLAGEEAFRTYMRILADYEERALRYTKNRMAAKILRALPPETAFGFNSHSGFIGHTAYSLDQFCELLSIVPADSIQYHLEREDFTCWIREVLGDNELAESIRNCTERQELTNLVCERRQQLWNHLK
jgi:alpha-amylase